MRFPVRGWTAASVLVCVYFLILLPWGTTLVIQYPDERYYIHSAYGMIETGDYLIPRTQENELRLKKPIIPYWFSAAGFKVAGNGPHAFRLFYMAGACAILLLTYALARQFGARESDSLLAMLLLAGNPMFLRFAVNAIPDVPLTLFMTVAALGFTRLFLTPEHEEPPGWAVWTGWTGTALAILSKGLLPVAFIAFLFVFTLLADRRRLRQVFSPLPVLAAAALVASWYVYAFASHPESFAGEFLDDQVQRKLPHNPLSFFPAVPGYLGVIVVSFLFLPLVLAIASWRGAWASHRSVPTAVTFLLGWCGVVVLIFSAIGSVFGRYLMPVIPLIAVLLVLGFTASEDKRVPLRIWSRRLLAALLVLQAVLLLFGVMIELQLAPLWEAMLVAGLALAVLILGAGGLRNPGRAPYLLPIAMTLTAPLIFPPIARFASPHPAMELAARLNASGVDAGRAVVVGGQQLGVSIRLASGRLTPFRAVVRDLEDIGAACAVMTTDAGAAGRLREKGFAVERVEGGWRERHSEFVHAVLTWRLAEARKANGMYGYFALCPDAGAPAG